MSSGSIRRPGGSMICCAVVCTLLLFNKFMKSGDIRVALGLI